MSKKRWFRCGCCGQDFQTHKPQDPERDRGYGTCTRCASEMESKVLEHQVHPAVTTPEQWQARCAKYA